MMVGSVYATMRESWREHIAYCLTLEMALGLGPPQRRSIPFSAKLLERNP